MSATIFAQFLSKEEGEKEFQSSPYLHSFNPNEVYARGHQKKENVINDYQKEVREFNRDEIDLVNRVLLTYSVNKLDQNCLFRSTLMKTPLRFIKVSNKYDWGYPYTINNCIVLPEKWLLSSTMMATTTEEEERLLNILEHEIIHLYQREGGEPMATIWSNSNNDDVANNNGGGHISIYHQNKLALSRFFTHIYQEIWNFVRVEPHQFINLEHALERCTFISNPDGDNFRWIIKMTTSSVAEPPLQQQQSPATTTMAPTTTMLSKLNIIKRWMKASHHQPQQQHRNHGTNAVAAATMNEMVQYWLPALIYNYLKKKPEGVLIRLEKINDSFLNGARYRLDILNIIRKIDQLPQYRHLFLLPSSDEEDHTYVDLSHPNEIIAYLLSGEGKTKKLGNLGNFIDKFTFSSSNRYPNGQLGSPDRPNEGSFGSF